MATPLRCPFCHDALAASADDRVDCAGCEAAHHLDCFIEGEGCAATGCGVQRGRPGGREPIRDLPGLVAWRAAGGAPRRTWISAVLMLALVMVVGAGLGLVVGGVLELALGWPVARSMAVGAGLGLLIALLLLLLPQGRRRGGVAARPVEPLPGQFDAITGMWVAPGSRPGTLGGVHDGLAERLAAEGPPEATRAARRTRPDGVTPDRCPDCSGDLLADGEDGDEEPLWTCFHCGADLVDLAGRYRGRPEAEPAATSEPGDDPSDRHPPRGSERVEA